MHFTFYYFKSNSIQYLCSKLVFDFKHRHYLSACYRQILRIKTARKQRKANPPGQNMRNVPNTLSFRWVVHNCTHYNKRVHQTKPSGTQVLIRNQLPSSKLQPHLIIQSQQNWSEVRSPLKTKGQTRRKFWDGSQTSGWVCKYEARI